MNEILTLGKLLPLIKETADYPGEVNELVKTVKGGDYDLSSLTDYITKNKVFLDVFSNLNPSKESQRDLSTKLIQSIKKLDSTSLRNVLFTCSLLSFDKNDMTRIILKKMIMSAYICKDIIEKVNKFRKTKHNPENFFLYALYHDIGELFAAIYFSDAMAEEIKGRSGHTDLAGIDNIIPHNEVGYMLARKWELPSIFSYICLNHNKLEYRKFTSDFIYIINAIAVSDAVALEILGYDTPFTNTWDVGHSIYKIGLREDDIYTESGLINESGKNINKILNLFNIK